jgi:hypothetical protein
MTYTIDTQVWKHSVQLGQEGHDRWPEMHDWCKNQFGAGNYTWTGSLFWFQNSQDAVIFMLKWG